MINKLLFILLLFLFTSLSSNAQVTYPTWEWAVTDSSVLVGDWCMFEHHFFTVGNNFTRWDTNGNKLLTNHLVQGKQLIFDNHHHTFVLGTMTADS